MIMLTPHVFFSVELLEEFQAVLLWNPRREEYWKESGEKLNKKISKNEIPSIGIVERNLKRNPWRNPGDISE